MVKSSGKLSLQQRKVTYSKKYQVLIPVSKSDPAVFVALHMKHERDNELRTLAGQLQRTFIYTKSKKANSIILTRQKRFKKYFP